MNFYMIGISYLSPIRFGYQAMIEIQFDSNQVQEYQEECTFLPKGCFEEQCAVKAPGSKFCDPFATLNLLENGYWINIAILVAIAVGIRCFSCLVLYFIVWDRDAHS